MGQHRINQRRASFEQVMAGLNLAYERLADGPVEQLQPGDPFRLLVAADDEYTPLEIANAFAISCRDLNLFELYADAAKQGHEELQRRCETLTMGEVAEHLRSIVPPTSLEPIEIAGTRCGKAAAFLAIRELIPRWKRRWVAPSQRIADCLSTDDILSLRDSLKWIAPDRELVCSRWNASFWQNAVSLRVCSWLTLGIAVVIGLGGIPEVGAFFLLFTGLLRGIAAMIANELSPLPDGVETFRDLATAIAH